MSYGTVMVPLDGSGFARQALPTAVDLARRAGAKLLLVHVHAPYFAAPADEGAEAFVEISEDLRRSQKASLERIEREVADRGVEVSTALRDGPVVRALAREAEERADLVVMATHGRGPFSRFWLGSTADGLARTCTVPLLFLRPGDDEDAPRTFDHVLVPLDRSRLAEKGLGRAEQLARLTGARLTLVQVVPPVMEPGFSYPDLPEGLDPEAVDEVREEAEAYLGRVADGLADASLEVDTLTRVHQSAAHAILEAADELDVDLIALATHGRGGLERLLLGSVADKVLRGSDRPTLVYRPRDVEDAAESG